MDKYEVLHLLVDVIINQDMRVEIRIKCCHSDNNKKAGARILEHSGAPDAWIPSLRVALLCFYLIIVFPQPLSLKSAFYTTCESLRAYRRFAFF